jgi:hypothetical protein
MSAERPPVNLDVLRRQLAAIMRYMREQGFVAKEQK